MTTGNFNRPTEDVQSVDQKLVIVPFSYVSNVGGNVSATGSVLGDCIAGGTVTKSATGKHTFQLTDIGYSCLGGHAQVVTADTEDLTTSCSVAANGLVTIATKAGTALANTTTDATINGVIFYKCTDRVRL